MYEKNGKFEYVDGVYNPDTGLYTCPDCGAVWRSSDFLTRKFTENCPYCEV
jgi:hypothetical protein